MIGLASAIWLGVGTGSATAGPGITAARALPEALVIEAKGEGTARLVELRPYEKYGPQGDFPVVWEGRLDGKPIEVPRFEGKRDRLYSKFQLVDAGTGNAIGRAHYADDLSGLPAWDFAMPWPKGIKGVTCPVDIPDLIALGVKYVDTNVILSAVVDRTNPNPEETWEVDGRKVGINLGYIRGLDAQIKPMTDAGINVTLITLNGVPTQPDPGNPFINPRTDLAHAPHHLGAFNLTDEEGVLHYRAAMEYLAHRYSDPSGEHGWVSGYIVGNEIQSHWPWHNLGEATSEELVADYAPALRVAWLAIRRHHAKVRVYVSLEHNWGMRGEANALHACAGRDVIEQLNALTKAEGDFPWDVAFHPYPQNLFEPRFWKDDLATMALDTPKLTFRNLEVLPAYLKQERLLYRGRPRRITLSEQGFHCPEGPEGEKIQAAAYAYAYYKTSHIPEIDAFILHRHVDHRAEGGLHLGLWSCKPDGDNPCAPDRKRLAWDVFRAADAEDWERAFEFAKPTIGIGDWREALPQTGEIARECGMIPEPLDPKTVVYDLVAHMEEAETVRWIGWRGAFEKGADGKLRWSVYQHPPGDTGSPDATFTIPLPRVKAGQRLVFRFDTAVTNEQSDGVGFRVLVDGEEVLSHDQRPVKATAHEVDLTRHGGKTIRLTLRVDQLGTPTGDWANWVGPVVVRTAVQSEK
ncbi:MAG: hypothetical protein FJX75_09415 [Armatimonadetes bacterium]|nr:hypothetical protein [Armatimonadota bacterium]